jgi:1,4-dihydroxy-2-naphthoate octaprenyltransferase
VFVFVFFGLVATAGTAYVVTEKLTALAIGAAVPVGLLATALLVTNNLRDIPGDTASGKRTLAVRLGDRLTRVLYVGLVLVALAGMVLVAIVGDRMWALLGLIGMVFALRPIRQVLNGARGPQLVPVLIDTGRFQLVCGLLFAIGIALSG